MNEKKYDFLIVGAGLFGAVFACLAHRKGLRCLVIDKRQHTGGNLYCENTNGINVHRYGPHIFHTSDRRIWDFVNSFVHFNRFTNAPLAYAPDGKLYNLPFNMNTFCRLWDVKTPGEALEILERQRREARETILADGHSAPRNLEEQALLSAGKDIYRLLVKGYTEKQWGRPCCELPAFIIRRIPLRLTFDNNYFTDTMQGIPEGGYNALFDGLLDGIDVSLSTDFFDRREHWENIAHKIVFTGKIDEFYNYRFGHLQYRSLRFETEIIQQANFQGNAVVNYTSASVPYTRIIEHKHFETFGDDVYTNPITVITREYPAACEESDEAFYPVNDDRNRELYERYRSLALADDRLILGGRLAEYRYIDMAPVIAEAFRRFSETTGD